jgi:hypothetical protein
MCSAGIICNSLFKNFISEVEYLKTDRNILEKFSKYRKWWMCQENFCSKADGVVDTFHKTDYSFGNFSSENGGCAGKAGTIFNSSRLICLGYCSI